MAGRGRETSFTLYNCRRHTGISNQGTTPLDIFTFNTTFCTITLRALQFYFYDKINIKQACVPCDYEQQCLRELTSWGGGVMLALQRCKCWHSVREKSKKNAATATYILSGSLVQTRDQATLRKGRKINARGWETCGVRKKRTKLLHIWVFILWIICHPKFSNCFLNESIWEV